MRLGLNFMVQGKAHINVDETNQDIFHVFVSYLEGKASLTVIHFIEALMNASCTYTCSRCSIFWHSFLKSCHF